MALPDANAAVDADRGLDVSADDVGLDGPDSGLDAGIDSGIDAGFDASGVDGGPVFVDAGTDAAEPDAARDAGDAGPATFTSCFDSQYVGGIAAGGPDYDGIPGVVVGSHCQGTNHQDITGVQRVVFIGDSVTVGSPPTLSQDWYRVRLATQLASEFGLDRAAGLTDGFAWEQWTRANPVSGTTVRRSAGDFSSCAEWGARADDLQRDSTQLEDCFPAGERGQRHLTVMTVGGNDLSNLTQAAIDGADSATLWAQTREYVGLVRDAVTWLKDPARFPAGNDVIFANVYEFTDGTGEVNSCTTASIAGFDSDEPVADALAEMVVWANEQFMDIAVSTGSDMVFLLETFCGHGYKRNDPTGPCYRGPGQALYFDLTCIHPNAQGHGVISELFMSVVRE